MFYNLLFYNSSKKYVFFFLNISFFISWFSMYSMYLLVKCEAKTNELNKNLKKNVKYLKSYFNNIHKRKKGYLMRLIFIITFTVLIY